MYTGLNEVFGWNEDSLPSEKLILISDSLLADGSFLLPHFINFYIKSKQRVILVGLEQSFSHYMAISRKLGVNLQQAHSLGQFVYVNGLASPYEWTDPVTTETNNPATMALQTISNGHPFSLNTQNSDPLKDLYIMIEKLMSSSNKSTCVIFDNLSAFSHVVGEEQLSIFVQYCRSLIELQYNKNNTSDCLVVLAHGDVDQFLINSLSHKADLVMRVDGFKTGYSNEEDGQLSFYKATSQQQNNQTNAKLPVLLFKLLDTTVNFRVIRKNTLNY